MSLMREGMRGHLEEGTQNTLYLYRKLAKNKIIKEQKLFCTHRTTT